MVSSPGIDLYALSVNETKICLLFKCARREESMKSDTQNKIKLLEMTSKWGVICEENNL